MVASSQPSVSSERLDEERRKWYEPTKVPSIENMADIYSESLGEKR
jgi:hypothetical protein